MEAKLKIDSGYKKITFDGVDYFPVVGVNDIDFTESPINFGGELLFVDDRSNPLSTNSINTGWGSYYYIRHNGIITLSLKPNTNIERSKIVNKFYCTNTILEKVRNLCLLLRERIGKFFIIEHLNGGTYFETLGELGRNERIFFDKLKQYKIINDFNVLDINSDFNGISIHDGPMITVFCYNTSVYNKLIYAAFDLDIDVEFGD